MKIVLDTNVFISGVFFSGPPYQILKAWRNQEFQIVISPEILDEYHRVGKELSAKFSMVDIGPILKLIIAKAELVEAASLDEAVCDDPDDDKFFAGAIAGESMLIVSGDKHLLKMSGYQGIEVIRPRQFVDKYL
ncbi:putative toxin-antitoxin system toxin component, PIN family [Desulfobacula sp.]|uniref:putative toxin-antitoxin system toxin component, PIN family n=1 Tax=Desulfobacula sp. TaxID=2593537 RepID=UPI001EB522C4|nr:putative toxin-antitoxin system toxin component, PIN family [Desulfobacula sp.]